jgi:hypothetical protein
MCNLVQLKRCVILNILDLGNSEEGDGTGDACETYKVVDYVPQALRAHVNERCPPLWRHPAFPKLCYSVVECVWNCCRIDCAVLKQLLVEALGNERTILIIHGPDTNH